jgi:mRNA turnover protein 4
MAKALGTDPASSHLPNLYKLAPFLHGTVGLLFTTQTPASILAFLTTYSATDYARAGIPASHSFTIPAGVVHSTGGQQPATEDLPLPHSVEPTLRKWGMPTRLVKGSVMLEDEYTVCREGEVLNSNQTALLKMFGVAMAEFKVVVRAYYEAGTEQVVVVDAEESGAKGEEESDDE